MDLSHIYFLQEIGEKSNQEDYILPAAGTATKHDKVFIVCDGVGGSDNGEVASRIVSEYVGNGIRRMQKPEMSGDIINDLLLKAKQELVQFAQDHRLNNDMGTTFTLLVLSADKAFLAWCGDSRIYHIRNGEILYRTADHSLVNTLVRSGEITEEEALTHPRRNLILRAIKADETAVEAEFGLIENLLEGDYFMLCTDGLLENITDKDLKFLLARHEKENIDLTKSFQELCFGKTKDNYSMYLLRMGKPIKSPLYNRKILILILLLVVLVSASAVTFSRYFARKQHIDVMPATMQPADTTRSVLNESTVDTKLKTQGIDTFKSGGLTGNAAMRDKQNDTAHGIQAVDDKTKTAIGFTRNDSTANGRSIKAQPNGTMRSLTQHDSTTRLKAEVLHKGDTTTHNR